MASCGLRCGTVFVLFVCVAQAIGGFYPLWRLPSVAKPSALVDGATSSVLDERSHVVMSGDDFIPYEYQRRQMLNHPLLVKMRMIYDSSDVD